MSIELSELIRSNRWIIAASIFFIIWKFFLIGILWDGRTVAPEPDDSYEYIARIAAVSECQHGLFCPYTGVSMYDHSGFAYLSYGLIFGLIGKAFSLKPEFAFHFSFYIGTIILAIVLPLFLSSFTKRKSLIALCIVFLAFYHGTGESHGFFWVVPSFYFVTFFFFLFWFITTEQRHSSIYVAVIPLSILYAFMHPISIYLVFFFPLYLFAYYIFTNNFSLIEIKKVLIILFVVLGSASLQSLYLTHASQINYYGLGSSILQARQVVGEFVHEEGDTAYFKYNVTSTDNVNLLASRINTLQVTYFRYIIPHWIMILPFTLMLFVLFIRHKFQLLVFYFSAFFFFIVATFLHEFGFRSAIILWPATYVVAAFSFYYIYTFILDQLTGSLLFVGRLFAILLFALFCSLNGIFSIGYNLNVNERYNYRLNDSFTTALLERMAPGDHIGLNGILARTHAGSKLFLEGKVASTSSHPRFIARIDQSAERRVDQQLSFIRKLSLETAHRMGLLTHNPKPAERDILAPIEGYHLDSRFGDITIFERN